MSRLPSEDAAIAVVRAIGEQPTVPMHEHQVLRAIAAELGKIGLAATRDRFGQLSVRISSGSPARPLAIVAHTDHPGFEVVEASGSLGRVRVLGGLQTACFAEAVPVEIHDDAGGTRLYGVIDDFQEARDRDHNSSGTLRLVADGELRPGMWAVIRMPGVERAGDELRMRAADDLAGCAILVLTLAQLASEGRAFDVHALFTRAEETGLYGARLAAELGTIPRDAYVVSVEASRELPSAQSGKGIVVRAGDLMNTFSNEAERALRVGRERLAHDGIATQRALLTGGTCEASAFVSLGYLATGIALPNVNYHNLGPNDRFAPEIVRISDVTSGVALLAEAAVAAGENAVESGWPRNAEIPESVRRALSSS